MRDEAFFFERVEDDAELHAAAVFVGDRHAELRIAVREVSGAVERIDDPSMVALMRAGAAFLGEDRMGGKCAMDNFDNRRFGFPVGFGDQIDRVRLAIDGYSAEPFEMNSAGGTRGAERNLFDFVDHGKGRYYSRSEPSSAKRRSIDRSVTRRKVARDFTSAGFRPGRCRARLCRSARGRGRWRADDSGRRGRRGSSAPSGIFSASRARRRPPCSSRPRG